MIRTGENLKRELTRLIEISCSGNLGFRKFTHFHKALVKIAYNAVDISFDYERRRVHMNIVLDENKEEVPKMPVNLAYRNLGEFLQTNISMNTGTIMQYTFLLMGTISQNRIKLSSLSEV